MNIIIPLVFLFLGFGTLQEDPAMKPVRDLFKGMETGDSSLVRSAFHPDAVMRTIMQEGDSVWVREGDIEAFLQFIGSPREYVASEPIWNIRINNSGTLASIWADYALYIGRKLSHCGVDAFQLAKIDNKWLIIAVTDTRRKQNCNIPEEIRKKYVTN